MLLYKETKQSDKNISEEQLDFVAIRTIVPLVCIHVNPA